MTAVAQRIDSPLLEFWRRFRRRRIALAAGIVILLIVLRQPVRMGAVREAGLD